MHFSVLHYPTNWIEIEVAVLKVIKKRKIFKQLVPHQFDFHLSKVDQTELH